VPLWEQPWVLNVAKIVAGLVIVLVLVFSVLKPLMRSLLGPVRPLMQAALPGGGSVDDAPPRRAGGNDEGSAQATPLAYEQQLAQARTLVGQDPKRVAQVVRAWTAEEQ
jgi:flagellar M-ring protein FliF